MEARELRIGNLVTVLNFGPAVKITPQHIVAISEGDTVYKPIPLSAEWLERLSFEKDSTYWYYKDFGLKQWENGEFWYGKRQVKHVHQLMNLFYSLTGEELTLKEPVTK